MLGSNFILCDHEKFEKLDRLLNWIFDPGKCAAEMKDRVQDTTTKSSSNVITFKGMSATHVIYVSDCSGVINKNSHVSL